MASRTSTDPIEILLEMGVDLDNLSEEEDYLSALMEAVNTLTIKNAKDPRISPLQQEIVKVRKKRKAADTRFKARKTTVSKSKLLGTSAIVPKKTQIKKEQLLALPPAAEEKEDKKKKPKEKNFLKEIAQSVTNIADILKNQYKLKEKSTEQDRKRAEQQKRKLQEAGLEKRFKGILKTAEKIVAPVRSIFDRILQFLTNILLGKFLVKLVEWISDPDNRSKITSIIRFLTDNWPKLLSAYIVFGTGIGKFARFLVKVLARGAVRLVAATAGLLARLFGARGLGRFSRFLGKRGKLIAGGVEAVGTIFAFKALEDAFTKNLGPEESASIDNDIPVSGYQGGGLVQPIFKFGGGGRVNLNLISPNGVLGYEEGGEVDGPSGIDKVPAMLTDGEFVMSRGAVQKYGLAQLEAMNAAGGGTNRPKMMNGTVFAVGGGPIGDRERTPDPELRQNSSRPSDYRTGSLLSDPLGALDRILGQSSGGKFRLPGMGSESPTPPPSRPEPSKSDPQPKPPQSKPPKSKPKSEPKEPLIPGKADPPPPEEPGIPEKMLSSPTFRDSGLLYLRHLMGGLGGAITEQDLSKETKHELNTAIGRAKERHAANLAKATREWEEAKKGGWNKSSSKEGRDAYATRKSQYERLKSGQVQVLYQDYYDGNDEKNITESAEDAKSVLGQFWAQQTKDGGYRIVNEKYDFQPMNDPLAVLMGDSRGIAKDAKDGKPGQKISLRNKLQAIAQLNPFTKDMTVDMILGQPETAERQTNNILRKMGGVMDFIMRDTTDFDGQGIVASSEAKGEMGVPFPETTPVKPETPLLPENVQKKMDEKPKLTAEQIKNNQAYAASKGKYYSSTTGKTYANYAAALKDPAVAAGAKKMQQKRQSTMAMLMGGKDAYYSSTTGRYYKNYTEALKDPQVAAAAKIEETKKKLSFAPTQPSKVTIPGMPTNASGSNVTVVKAPSKSAPAAEGNTGSSVPAIDAGNGNKSKWKIFGMSLPF